MFDLLISIFEFQNDILRLARPNLLLTTVPLDKSVSQTSEQLAVQCLSQTTLLSVTWSHSIQKLRTLYQQKNKLSKIST